MGYGIRGLVRSMAAVVLKLLLCLQIRKMKLLLFDSRYALFSYKYNQLCTATQASFIHCIILGILDYSIERYCLLEFPVLRTFKQL